MRWNVTPNSSSPSRIAHATGTGPRWCGRSDGWPLIQPSRGTASASAGTFHGKPMQTTRSGRTDASSGAIDARRAGMRMSSSGRQLVEHPAQVEAAVAAVGVADREQRDRLVPGVAQRRVEAERDRQDPRHDDDAPRRSCLSKDPAARGLVARLDDDLVDVHVPRPRDRPHDAVRDVLRRQRVDSLVDRRRLARRRP